MKITVLILSTLVLSLSACAIKRPLIRPADIPAYEEKQRKKIEDREEFLREQQQREDELERQPSAPAQTQGT